MNYVFILFLVAYVIDLFCKSSWSEKYFLLGPTIYHEEFDFTKGSFSINDVANLIIDKLNDEAYERPFLIQYSDENGCYLFREKISFFRRYLGLRGYYPMIHGTIEIEEDIVAVKGKYSLSVWALIPFVGIGFYNWIDMFLNTDHMGNDFIIFMVLAASLIVFQFVRFRKQQLKRINLLRDML